ncbi:hypothetical protein SUDANB105_00587 [Streptomyces sp. enrichment culture]|uniref:hypothetical protein n=1 Tax=Streptomyces sp. enrichment culture TaxID=1795815 RepID=UPI003F569DB5
MSRSRKITVITLSVAGVASIPLVWLLDGPDAGQLVGATLQFAVAALAFCWAVRPDAPRGVRARLEAVRAGAARAEDGGKANAGVRVRGRMARGIASARAQDTGKSTAKGRRSEANSGVEIR